MRLRCKRRNQGGFGAVAAIIVLVLLSLLAAAVLRFGQSSQRQLSQDLLGARALAAARAGTEWGLYQAFKGSWGSCSNSAQTLDLRSDSGFLVTVSCDSQTYSEGETAPGVPRTLRVYRIDALACNGASACPDNGAATGANYVERRLQVQASD